MKRIKIAFCALMALSAASCSKVIEVRETDFVGGDIALKTVANNEQAVIGAYAGMSTDMSILFNAVMTDEVKKGEFYNAATVHEWQFGINDVSIRDNFTAIYPQYTLIDRVNRVLAVIDNADSMKAGDNALRNRVKGEALFIRAYSHFELFRYYSPNYDPAAIAMPYMETVTLKGQARITQGPYFEKIKADMAAAKALLPNNLNDVYRANVATVAGLQARVALYTRDWANAITYATEFINAVPLATRAQFPAIWTDAANTESAFKLRRTNAIGSKLGSLFRGTSASASNIGQISWNPSNEMWDSFDQTNDVRFPAYFKVETRLPANRSAYNRLINKYAGTDFGTSGENVADAKVFRTAEMLLIRAEAKAETGDLAGAAADINLLRDNRIANNTAVTFASKDEAINNILQERFKELAYEGHRLFDLKRRNLPVTRSSEDAPNANATTLPAGNFRFVLPIPQTEMNANKAMTQNAGYN
ncbi:RagB/SusD family nutrient uptake outer membrane protein [Pseudocnuella soli]|uniref:RagB/SusD family nutrient uptake outer membrane protein n=1 Tax=Pseudocnuella soli TaxID=2502779 RepID=UPI00104E117F|nr:RagB/SusD family nutrient uptake outer membrane protein [Pseudocnuella soli]